MSRAEYWWSDEVNWMEEKTEKHFYSDHTQQTAKMSKVFTLPYLPSMTITDVGFFLHFIFSLY